MNMITLLFKLSDCPVYIVTTIEFKILKIPTPKPSCAVHSVLHCRCDSNTQAASH